MSNDLILTATEQNFAKSVLRSRLPVVVDFWAPWCGPCKTIAPLLDELASEFSGKVRVAKVNIDENPQLAREHKVRSIPMLLVLKKGEVLEQHLGAAPMQTLRALFERANLSRRS